MSIPKPSRYYLFVLAAFTLIFTACRKKDKVAPVDTKHKLTITVYNAFHWSADKPKGTLQPGATVTLYTSRANYNAAKPNQTIKADANGQAVFTVEPGTYFMVAKWQDVGKLAGNIVINKNASTATVKKGYVPAGLFQSDNDVAASPQQVYAKPGNFKWQDLNADGVITANDLVELPFVNAEISDKDVSFELILGDTDNDLLAATLTKDVIYTLLDKCASTAYQVNNRISTIDAIISDDASCLNGFYGYCNMNSLLIDPSNLYIGNVSDDLYSLVTDANTALYYASYLDLANPAEKAFFQAEAKAFRGYAYLTLATYFGQADIVTSVIRDANYKSTLDPRAQVYAQAKHDLEDVAAATIPSGFVKPGYITKYAAMALAARLALQTKDYSSAKSYSDQILLNGHYEFSTTVTDAFTNLVSKENIWSFPQDNEGPYPTEVIPGQARYRPMVRLSEVYLTKAEAMIYNGQFKDARSVLLTIALRRKITLEEFTTQAKALEKLYDVSRVETYREGRRYCNLVRWGIIKDVLPAYHDYNNILPIPSHLLLTGDPTNKQNPGY